MFIVLTLHQEDLRQMMKAGKVNHSIKVKFKVLQMLEKQVCSHLARHADIKDYLVLDSLC